ncbi:MAG TPA: alpha/beta hydrolase, partial [Candidatus Berkiella sp.]|nr:alpha/beta hydrolase [Candidatus Berkiella sp.]
FANLHRFSTQEIRQYLQHPKLKVTMAAFQDFQTHHGLTLRCYTPLSLAQDERPCPVVIYLSATAFVLDRLDACNDYCSLLANNLNMKVINIAHRLAPEHKFPRFLYDCTESIEWIYQHAKTLTIDPEKIAIWGESSGGSIAATSTHVLRDAKLPIIKHQTLFYPMVDLVNPFRSKALYSNGFMLDKSFVEWLDKRGFHPEQDRSCPLASPLLSTHFAHLPPATVISAQYDPLRDEGEAYAKKLRQAGVSVTAKRFKGMIHGFMRFYPKVAATQDALDYACVALKHHFKEKISQGLETVGGGTKPVEGGSTVGTEG